MAENDPNKKHTEAGLGNIFDSIKNAFDRNKDDDESDAPKAEAKPDHPQGTIGAIAERMQEEARKAQQSAAQKADDEPRKPTWAESIKEKAMDAMQQNNAADDPAPSKPNAGTISTDTFAEALKNAAEAAQQRSGTAHTQAAPSAPSAPAAPAAPAAPEPQRYTVRGGDTLGKIAKHFYGDASQWRRIYDANRDSISNPDVIHAGQEFVIPNADGVQANEQRTYTVRGGDTLRAIAERFYGDEMQWRRIYDANRDSISNPDVIHVGQEFIIP